MKVHPYYDRSDLVRVTTDTVEGNLVRGMVFVLIVLIFFLVSWRAAVIVALTIPLALLFSFIFLHGAGVAANLLSTSGCQRDRLPTGSSSTARW